MSIPNAEHFSDEGSVTCVWARVSLLLPPWFLFFLVLDVIDSCSNVVECVCSWEVEWWFEMKDAWLLLFRFSLSFSLLRFVVLFITFQNANFQKLWPFLCCGYVFLFYYYAYCFWFVCYQWSEWGFCVFDFLRLLGFLYILYAATCWWFYMRGFRISNWCVLMESERLKSVLTWCNIAFLFLWKLYYLHC